MTRATSTLLVRHLPSELDHQEKIDLICHFGAECVRPMGTKGPLKHTAFAKFASPHAAERCLKRLHQLDVLGCKVVVEFAKLEQEKKFPVDSNKDGKSKNDDNDDKAEKPKGEILADKPNKTNLHEDETFKKHGLSYPRKPSLHYLYPPPTVSTLTNIANALASHPRFYTQVLHLMNKMNLPCPFGSVTPSPPLALDNIRGRTVTGQAQGEYVGGIAGEIEEVEMEYASTEESEIDSDGDGSELRNSGKKSVTTLRKSVKRPRKKMKLVQPDMSLVTKPASVPKPSEVFESVDNLKPKEIVLHLPGRELSSQYQTQVPTNVNMHAGVVQSKKETQTNTLQVVEGGFGKVEPQVKPKQSEEEIKKADVNYKINPKNFVHKDKISAGRLKQDQMKDFSVFKNYRPGEPTSRLYIKNLTKQTVEQDLVDLFGSYIDWTEEISYNTFDIRLMKEGRMKGQAFVTLPDEESSRNIVADCNGFILNNKPIVIQFARSAKAKEVDKMEV